LATVIDTGLVPPGDRFEFWSAASCDAYHPLELRRDFDRPFWGRAQGNALGALRVFRIAADASSVARTPRAIAAHDPEQLIVAVNLRGRFSAVQGGRSTLVEPGDITSYESSHPYVVHAPTPFEIVAVLVPKALLRPHGDRICAATARTVSGRSGLGKLAARFFEQVADGFDDGTLGEDGASVAEAMLDLVRGLVLTRDAGVDEPRARTRADLLLRIQRFIEANLADPELSPERIARANAVSVRYLHKLFEPQGVTVGEWVRDKRLDRCRRDLSEPALRGETILAIASRWGLTNAAHFSRIFRDAYGCSPREFRNTALVSSAAHGSS
jgi:AraC-like DNA-binding protein